MTKYKLAIKLYLSVALLLLTAVLSGIGFQGQARAITDEEKRQNCIEVFQREFSWPPTSDDYDDTQKSYLSRCEAEYETVYCAVTRNLSVNPEGRNSEQNATLRECIDELRISEGADQRDTLCRQVAGAPLDGPIPAENQGFFEICQQNYEEIYCRFDQGLTLGDTLTDDQQRIIDSCVDDLIDEQVRDTTAIDYCGQRFQAEVDQYAGGDLAAAIGVAANPSGGDNPFSAPLFPPDVLTQFNQCTSSFPENYCAETYIGSVASLDELASLSEEEIAQFNACVNTLEDEERARNPVPTRGTVDIPSNPIFEELLTVINFLSAGVGVIVTIMIVVGGGQFITSTGDPAKIKAAREKIFNALVALGLFIFMYAILQWLIPGGFF